jgi:Family of unknown function (DUF6496)
MAESGTLERAREDAREGKSASTQAGEFVREEMRHIREGKHGARSTKQAIAIGLSKARRAGVRLKPPTRNTSKSTRQQAARDLSKGQETSSSKPSRRRSRATLNALKREGHRAASPMALSEQARASALRRGRRARMNAAQEAVRTKGRQGLRRAAQKAARTRQRAT